MPMKVKEDLFLIVSKAFVEIEKTHKRNLNNYKT